MEDFKNESGYNTGGKVILRASYFWDQGFGDWIGNSKRVYGYDAMGNTDLYATYQWDYAMNKWAGTEKIEFAYNAYGRQLIYTYSNWEPDAEDWNIDYKIFYYYGECYHLSEVNSLCHGDSLMWQGHCLKTDTTCLQCYTSTTGRDSIYELDLHVNPNPAPFTITGQDNVEAFSIHMYTTPSHQDITYSWSADNGNLVSNPSVNAAEIQWGDAGIGRIKSIAENQYGCRSDTAVLEVHIASTGFSDVHESGHHVYPNPAEDHVYIKTGAYGGQTGYLLKVTDPLGKTVLETAPEKPLYRLSTGNWGSRGLYYIQVIDSQGEIIDIKKIVLQ
jgi:hypothetical protein